MSLMGVVIVKFTHTIARVLERVEIRAGRGVTFGAGIAGPLVALLPTVGSRASASLSHGSRNRRVGAASSIPQGVCSLHHGCSRPVVASSYRFTHGWRQANKEQSQKKDQCQEKHQEEDVVLASP